jgi:hypothetical protein
VLPESFGQLKRDINLQFKIKSEDCFRQQKGTYVDKSGASPGKKVGDWLSSTLIYHNFDTVHMFWRVQVHHIIFKVLPNHCLIEDRLFELEHGGILMIQSETMIHFDT